MEPQKTPTAEQILEQGRRRRIQEVALAGGVVYAYGMTRAESAAYRAECTASAGSVPQDTYADERLVLHMIRNAQGQRIFSESHLPQLADMNVADFAVLFGACADVNGWSEKAQENLRKNSATTRTCGSGSDSPFIEVGTVPTM